MQKPQEDSLLRKPIATTGISDTFSKAAVLNGFNTLEELLAIPLTELLDMGWFTPSMLKEIEQIMKDIPR